MRLLGILSAVFFAYSIQAAYEPTERPYDVKSYKLRFSLDPRIIHQTFPASVEVQATAKEDLSEIVLNAEDLKVASVKRDGKALTFSLEKNFLTIDLGKKLSKASSVTLLIQYEAKVRSSHEGIFRVTDPDEPDRGNLYFTMLEAESARMLFPCNDEPHDKAITEVIGTVPAGFQVIANGKLVSERKVKEKGENWKQFDWKMSKPHSTYLLSFGVGKFSKMASTQNKKEVSIYVGETKLKKAEYALESTKQSLAFFENYLGTKYPWEKYATVCVPTFLWGGMENTSSTHMNQERILLNHPLSSFERKLITGLGAHELAHQWFGDYVTMKWWDDVWLNEAFASYMATIAQKDAFKTEEADVDFMVDLWDRYFREENGPRSHAIVSKNMTSAGDGFDSTNYTKGEAVLRMLRFYLGDEKFRKGIKSYLSQFAFSNATYIDFFNAMGKSSGEDLASFRDSWLLQRGFPIITYFGNWNEKSKTYEMTVSQRPNHSVDSGTFQFRLPVVFHRKTTPAYSKEVVISMKEADLIETYHLPAQPEWINVNSGSPVLAQIEPKNGSEAELSLQAENDPDPISRVWANYQLANPLLNSKEPSMSAQKTLLQRVTEDRSPYVRNAVLDLFQRTPAKQLPDYLAKGILELSQQVLGNEYEKSPLFTADPHGWLEFRSKVIASLGKVPSEKSLPVLVRVLQNPNVPLDDFSTATSAVAMTASSQATEILSQAMSLHGKKGYRYRFHLSMAYGALEDPKAAKEIAKLAETATPDLMGRIGWVIRDNQTLKTSSEWAAFLKEFVLKNDRFGDEIKARMLQTVEEVNTSEVKKMLQAVSQGTQSERLRELTSKILSKNFSG